MNVVSMRSNIGKVCRAQCEFFLQPGLLVFISLSYMLVYCHLFFFSSTSLLLPTHLPPPSCMHAQACNPVDCSLPGSSVHGLSQARILGWVAISFSRGSSPQDQTLVSNIGRWIHYHCATWEACDLLSYLFNVAEN